MSRKWHRVEPAATSVNGSYISKCVTTDNEQSDVRHNGGAAQLGGLLARDPDFPRARLRWPINLRHGPRDQLVLGSELQRGAEVPDFLDDRARRNGRFLPFVPILLPFIP